MPADMPHLVLNRSDAVCRALVAYPAADDQAGIVMRPELNGVVQAASHAPNQPSHLHLHLRAPPGPPSSRAQALGATILGTGGLGAIAG